jgi:hypothetical protein
LETKTVGIFLHGLYEQKAHNIHHCCAAAY